MKTYSLTVFVAADKLGQLNKDQLDAAVRSKSPVGALQVTVKYGPRSDKVSDPGYHLTGRAVAVDFSDATDLAGYIDEVNERLATDLGTIGAVSKSDPYADNYSAGNPVDINYVLNHGGLPLAYGNAIKETFAERKGRQSVAAAVTNALADFQLAVAWAVGAGRMDLLSAKPDALIEAYRSSKTGN